MEQPKIERMLRFIKLLANKRGYTVDEIAQRLEISRRSVFRYIETFKGANFVFKNEDGRYSLITNDGTMKELANTIWFSEEEAYVIKTLIDELDNTNGMKAGLIVLLDDTNIQLLAASKILKIESKSQLHLYRLDNRGRC